MQDTKQSSREKTVVKEYSRYHEFITFSEESFIYTLNGKRLVSKKKKKKKQREGIHVKTR